MLSKGGPNKQSCLDRGYKEEEISHTFKGESNKQSCLDRGYKGEEITHAFKG